MRILILGAGRSGNGTAALALKLGQIPIIADEKNISVSDRILGVEYLHFTGSDTLFPEVSFAVLSPGIVPDSVFGKWAYSGDVPVISELEYGATHTEIPILAVTGTNGKTTTTELTVHLLNALGIYAVAAGNIGHALARAVAESFDVLVKPDVFVVEVSSFQLEAASAFLPNAAVLLNITSDHLNRYDSFEAYGNTKMKVFAHAKYCFVRADLLDWFVRLYPRSDAVTFSETACEAVWQYRDGLIYYQNEDVVTVPEKQLPGVHNAENLTAALMLLSTQVPGWRNRLPEIQSAVDAFRLDSHRVELIAEYDGKRFVNDSKATNPDAVIVAVRLYGENHNIRLLLGGLDKEMDFSLLQVVAPSVAKAYIYGQCASKIDIALADTMQKSRFEKFEDAVLTAISEMKPGEVLLLSPACASMDQFRDYRARGDAFVRLVTSQN